MSIEPVTAPGETNRRLARRVTNLLYRRLELRRVTVDVADGTVVLKGTVGSFYHKQLCFSGSRRIPGVYKLIDEIQVADAGPSA
mgnify:CR=1 FL=1